MTEHNEPPPEEKSSQSLTPVQATQKYTDAENYFYGWNGYSQNKSRAVQLYQEAATNGNVLAQYRLACCYDKGDGVPMNWNEAKKWYASAAANGHSDAEKRLAKIDTWMRQHSNLSGSIWQSALWGVARDSL